MLKLPSRHSRATGLVLKLGRQAPQGSSKAGGGTCHAVHSLHVAQQAMRHLPGASAAAALPGPQLLQMGHTACRREALEAAQSAEAASASASALAEAALTDLIWLLPSSDAAWYAAGAGVQHGCWQGCTSGVHADACPVLADLLHILCSSTGCACVDSVLWGQWLRPVSTLKACQLVSVQLSTAMGSTL